MVLGVFITRVLGEFMYPVLIYIAMVLKHLKKSNDCPERKNMGSLPVLGGGFLNNWI
jgi:hypothetical protein